MSEPIDKLSWYRFLWAYPAMLLLVLSFSIGLVVGTFAVGFGEGLRVSRKFFDV